MPTIANKLRLAEHLVGRLCHDLAGPLGVLCGVLELAADAGATPELGEARLAADGLAQRLRLLRAAWGGEPAPLSVAALQALTAEASPRAGVRIDFTGLSRAAEFTAEAGQVMVNLVLLGIEALRGDGTLVLVGAPDFEVVLRPVGPRAAWPGDMVECLLDPRIAWERLSGAREVQMPMTALLAARAGLAISMLMPTRNEPGALPPLRLRLG